MASPPHRSAGSPPYPSNSTLPNRKRPLPGSSGNLPYPAKRTNTSFSNPSSSHPLRQTSFPPEEGQPGERSPSVDSIITAGTGARSVTASAKQKKKYRKRKDDTQSLQSGIARETDTASRTSRGPDEEIDGDEDEEIDRVVDDLVQTGGKDDDDEHEQQRIAVLLAAFDDDQSERYDLHRRVKLKKETVRKIVNQTLSQSVPPSVITTINGFTKVFLAELIERARDVQEQSIQAAESSLPTPPGDLPDGSNDYEQKSIVDGEPLKTDDGYLGPLLPDHFREALRRYRLEGQGAAGVEGRSVGLGITGSAAARLGGRRLFR